MLILHNVNLVCASECEPEFQIKIMDQIYSAIVEFVTPVLVAFPHLHEKNAKITGKICPIIKNGGVKTEHAVFPLSCRV